MKDEFCGDEDQRLKKENDEKIVEEDERRERFRGKNISKISLNE